MKATIFLAILIGLSSIFVLSPWVMAQAGVPTTWNKKVDCYGPFPTPMTPTGYNHTEMDNFNATLDGQNMGGVTLTCGPVLQGSAGQSVSGKFTVTANSTDLHWHELNWIIPQSTNPAPIQTLDHLFQNLTEYMYVNGHLFANLTIIFALTPPPPIAAFSWRATLTCVAPIYPWNFALGVFWNFTQNGTPLAVTLPAQVSCSSSKSTDQSSGALTMTTVFNDFHLNKWLNATYTAANQPSSLNKTTTLNKNPIDKTYIHYVSAVTPPKTPVFAVPVLLITIGTFSALLVLARKRLVGYKNPL